jgi:DNA-binding CsgD family transcriptional regulator
MGSRIQLRAADLSAWLRLAGELHELKADPIGRRRHAARSLGSLLDADFVYLVLAEGYLPAQSFRVHAVADSGQDPPLMQYPFLHGIEDPVVDKMKAVPARLSTCRPRDLMTRRAWHGTDFYNLYRRPCGVRDVLYSARREPGHGAAQGLAIYRCGRRPFSPSERALLHVFHERFEWEPAPVRPRCPLPKLSPRERQTLDGLLTGASEKQVADRLGLSVATVHQYVTSLYRRVRVTSRAELMARCLAPSDTGATTA